MKTRTFLILILLSGMLLLSACVGLYFSPEAAATSAALNSGDSNFRVDRASMQVHQTLKMSDDSRVVILSFQGDRGSTGPESCVYSYHVQKIRLGWQPSSGGGGCRTTQPNENVESIEIGAGQSGSSRPGDPGFSQVYGLVNHEDIVKVRIIWGDDQVDEVEVINSSYATARLGLFEMKRVEGLNSQGQPVYDNSPQIAPGKQ
jgi:hypothetical protein